MYNYNTSVNFKIESSGRPSGLVEGRKMFAIAVYETGVNGFPSYKINDPDYVLAYDDLSYSSDANYTYSFKILQAIDRRITNTASMKIFTYVIYDRDNNGKPSSGDDIAAYWENKFIIGSVPKKWTLTSDIVNTTTIKFLNKTY